MELLLSHIEKRADEQPGQTALQSGDRAVNYGELLAGIRNLAGALAAKGIAKGDAVALTTANSFEFVAGHFALMQLGAVCAAVHPQQTPGDLCARVAQVNPRGIIASDKAAGHLSAGQGSATVRVAIGAERPDGWLSYEDLTKEIFECPSDSVDPEDAAAILFTSGACGTPRGVELRAESFAYQAAETGRALRIRPSDRVATTCSFAGIFGLTLGVHLPLAHGAGVEIIDSSDGTNLLQTIRQREVTVFVGSPMEFASLGSVETGSESDLSALRFFICCGGALSTRDRTQIESRWKRPVLSAYGMVEACGLIAIRVYPIDEQADSVGMPLGSTEVAILNEKGQRTGPGKPGRIAFRSPAAMRGYFGAAETSPVALQDGWLITDDVGSLDYDSRLTVLGRSAETIHKGGFPVYASEVEDVMNACPGIREAAVIGVADQVYGEELKAFVVCESGVMMGQNEVIDHLKTRLPVYKCPRIIKFYKELPRTPEGKIRRGVLRDDRS